VNDLYSPILASLPLLLWRTPPGLELILSQEGVPFEVVTDAHPFMFGGGRFVLFDSRAVKASSLGELLGPDHVAIDVEFLRRGESVDPFDALIDHRSALANWTVGAWTLSERVARFPKAWIRRRLIGRLREAVTAAGGVWARLAPFPYPYRSAFSFRADLDEPYPDDYQRFALARAALNGCCTHFISTSAYLHHPAVTSDLKSHDTQSHGHFHHVYRDPDANRRNIERAHRLMRSLGFDPVGFAGPHGRWRSSLDDQLEDFGYLYSSDFQLGYDDLPFYPWKGDRFSRVLQVPVHPVCEGLFLEAGVDDPRVIGEYLRQVVAAKIDAGEMAIVYGHPERRLGRMPGVLASIARVVEAEPLVWRASFSEIARWWRWRAERRWLLIPRDGERLEVQFDEWDSEYPFAIEIHRGRFQCSIPVTGPRMSVGLAGLVYERRLSDEPAIGPPVIEREPATVKAAVRAALDWETVTPLEEIPLSSLSNRVKRGLRWLKHKEWRAVS
jgi:peptidoglycan/xylan/chitin deacetylase (PgdA/CDA1 family)